MKFSQKFLRRRTEDFSKKFSSGIWNPDILAWRDIIEDYLYISRKKINNKMAMFKLQTNILMDIINNVKIIDEYNNQFTELETKKETSIITQDEYDSDLIFIKSQLHSYDIINIALREIVDGIVWRYFNYNRAILYLLADKEPLGPLRPDKGVIESLYHFAEVFLSPDNVAIFNDISNFLRVGDITAIKNDGNIELIEIKASGGRGGGRITRQKKRMAEIVEFINIGITEYNGLKFNIMDSELKQKYYLNEFLDSIRRARFRGYDSILIGNHLIIQVIDFGKIDKEMNYIDYFEKRHASIREKWQRDNDVVMSSFMIDKLEYSRNYIPYSILPFDVDICTDIIIGRLSVLISFNYSEIFRMIAKSGWKLIDSFLFKSESELKQLEGKDVNDVPILVIRKGDLTIRVPSAHFGRLHFEFWSPKTLINHLEELYKLGPQDYDAPFINFTDDQRIWQ